MRIKMARIRKRISMIICTLVAIGVLAGCAAQNGRTFSFLETQRDFLNCDFGASREEVVASESNVLTDEKVMGDGYMLTYKDIQIDGFNANLIYMMEDEKFVQGILYLKTDDVEGVYGQLKSILNEKYGQAVVGLDEATNWASDKYYVTLLKSDKVVYSLEPIEHMREFMSEN